MIKRKYLNDKQNPANIIYPITDEQSVRDGNGVTLATKLSDLPQVKEGAALGRTAYQKPVTGIPASDIAEGVIPDVTNFVTRSVNDLVNYYTKSQTYTKEEVANLIAAIQQFHYEVVVSTSAVTSPSNNVLYLVGPTGSGSDKYEEYVYDSTKESPWIKIGDTSIDLSGYVTTQSLNTVLSNYVTSSDLVSALSSKQDTLVSGTNIKTINGESILGDGNIQIQGGSTDAVKYTEQSLTDAQKGQARTNIGAGTSSFSGSYNDLSNKPDIPDPLLTYTESGDVDPTVTPADYATREELDQLEAEYIDFPFNIDGYYLNASGEETSFWNGASTDFIPAKTGDIFYFTGQTTGVFRNVCAYNSSKLFISALYIGSGDNTKITITDSTIAYVRSCANKNDSAKSFKKYNPNSIEGISNKVGSIEGSISSSVYDTFSDGCVSGHYIAHDGRIGDGALFAYKEFAVWAGAEIKFTALVNSGMAAIAEKISNTEYKELVPATATETATFTYTATKDMVVAVSFYTGSGEHINIFTNYIGSNRANIVLLQNELQSVGGGMNIQSIELGFLFDKVAVIGDSMAVGTMDGYTPPIGTSWLSLLGKRWDCDAVQHYAMGGTGAYDWLNSTGYGLGKMLADETIYNAYFIAYGHNDSASVGEATDTAAPVTVSGGVPSCPSGYSFCAYLKAIVAQIRAKAPHAMIFMLSQYDYSVAPGGWHSQYGEAVIAVAEALYAGGDKLVHHLDTGGVPDEDMRLGTHYSTVGYAYIAKRVNDEVNKVMYQYRADTEIKTFGVYNL